MTLCQHKDCDNIAAYITVKGEYLCHKHKVEPAEKTDGELDRLAELAKWEGKPE